MKRSFCLMLCLFLVLGLVPAKTAFASTSWPEGVSIEADGGILIDAKSGAVLYEKNSHDAYYPASITKILTALIIIENCSLDDTVTFSHRAVNSLEPNSTILGARTGDTLSVRDCLYALLLQSANEVANALAEHCSGDMESFAELMNRKAQSLGCTDSHFSNPSGLNDEEHYTSAHDMARIAQAAFRNPTFAEIDSAVYYDVQPGQLAQYPNGWRYYAHHRMMKKNDSLYYSGILGGKTGYTSLAGNTLVTCAERDGLQLIAVVLNGHQTHYSDTKALLDFGFEHFVSVAIADKDDTYQKIEHDLTIAGIFSGQATRLSINKDSSITLPAGGDFSDVVSSLNYQLDGSAPDAAVARIDYMYGEKKVGQAYLEASVTQGYVPGSMASGSSFNDSGAVSTIAVTGKSTENTAAFGESTTPLEAVPTEEKQFQIPGFVKQLFSLVILLALIGSVAIGILFLLRRREEKERLKRQSRREKRLKEWGYSVTEFDQIMEEHLRSRGSSKKKRFFDRRRK